MELELIEEKSKVCNTNIDTSQISVGSPLIGIAILMGVVIVVAIGIKYLKDKNGAKIQSLITEETRIVDTKMGISAPQGVI